MPDIRIPSGSSTAAAAATASRYQAYMASQGYYVENFPRVDGISNTIMVTQSVYYHGVGLLAGDVVTNVHTVCVTLGSGFSGSGFTVGLYPASGLALVASSGDVSGLYASVGPKVNALSAPYTVPTTGLYYVALLGVATTMPILNRGLSGAVNANAIGAFSPPSGIQVTQAVLPNPATINSTSAANINYWVGIS